MPYQHIILTQNKSCYQIFFQAAAIWLAALLVLCATQCAAKDQDLIYPLKAVQGSARQGLMKWFIRLTITSYLAFDKIIIEVEKKKDPQDRFHMGGLLNNSHHSSHFIIQPR